MLKQITSIIGWIGTVLVFGAVAVKFGKPEWAQYATYAAWAGLVCVLVYLVGQYEDVRDAYGRRAVRYGTLSFVSILAVLGILVGVNYLSTIKTKRWDLTANQIFSLSDQTVKILQGLDAPVKMTAFYSNASNGPSDQVMRQRLDEYKYNATKLEVEYVDVDRNPARAKAADVQAYGTTVIEYKDRVERVTTLEEQDITNALIKAVTGTQRKVYFTQGHGEKDPTNSERGGYASIAQALGRDNYGTEKLVLAQVKDVPADATEVIVAGPKQDFFPAEIDVLKRYLGKGGKVLFMVDPAEKVTDPPLTNLEGLLEEWSVELGNDVVVDASGVGQLLGTDASVPVAASYPGHPITDRFNLMTAYPLARSVHAAATPNAGRSPQPVVETSAQSWAEADLKSLMAGQQVSLDASAGDKPGPVSLAVAVSAPAPDVETPTPKPGDTVPSKPETRVAVFGDSDFASNAALGISGNRDLFLNTVNWLAQQEGLISIRAREPEDRRLTLTADQQQRIQILSLLVIPGLVFAAGIWTWWKRR